MSAISKPNDSRWWKSGLVLVTAIFFVALNRAFARGIDYPLYLTSIRFKVFLATFTGMLMVLHALTWLKWGNKPTIRFVERIRQLRRLRWALFIGVLNIYGFGSILMEKYLPIFSGFWPWLFFFSLVVFLGGWLFHYFSGHKIWESLAMIGLGIGVIQQIIIYFPYPLSYPFSLTWSETSWYYYASFFFSRQLYDAPMPWPFLDIGRPLLLSAVYLVSKPPIWFIRIWEYILWLGSALLVSWCFIRRFKSEEYPYFQLTFWGFSWMLLGPVLYPLSLSVAIVLWGFDRDRFWKTIFWIGLASLWTGILRINWVPVPSILAISLYLLETPFPSNGHLLNYVRKPFFYAVFGLSAGIASFLAYLVLSGRADTRLGTKFSAPFLWYRLWPNATLATGILPGILLVSLGLIIAIFLSWQALRYHTLRANLLLGMQILLLAGGLIASVRIGGGNNLHNLDAYLVLIMVWGGYTITGNIPSERNGSSFHMPPLILLIIFLTPALWGWSPVVIPAQKNISRASQELNELKQLVEATSQQQGDSILFVHQRHLIPFGYIDTPMIASYELEELSEMANSGNIEYLSQFTIDLAAQKYALIIMDNSKPEFKSRQFPFAEENNAWVEYIMLPLQSYYQSMLILPESGVQVYAPIP